MPEPAPEAPPRVAVVGAGVTGLAAAHRLVEERPGVDLRLFEASGRAGGVLHTVRRDGYLIERSADNFLTREPWATDLCSRIGVGDHLLPTEASRRRALVVRGGRVLPAPEGFVLMAPKKLGSVLRSPVLSLRGKLRLACEPLVPRRRLEAGGDESVASFARRRLGREAFERLVQPLLAGIYTADPDRLSMAATMPQFLEQERKHGSLVLAALREKQPQTAAESRESGARYGLFLAPSGGMQQLVDALVEKLPAGALQLNAAVESIQRADQRWQVKLKGGGEEMFDAVIVTTPAHHAAKLLASSSDLAAALGEIEYAGCSVVCLGIKQSQIRADVPGFGFVVPTIERRRIIAASFASYKFPGRAPEGRVLVRAFVGGALQPGLAELPDDQLRGLALEELRELVGLTGKPELCEVARWPRGMPQYHVGHLERVKRIESLVAAEPGLELAGAAYRGVGVPQCIHDGEQAAERTAQRLATGK